MSSESNKETRKASDVILSIEQSVQMLVKVVANYDFNMKLMLQRIDAVQKSVDRLTGEEAAAPTEEPKPVQIQVATAPGNRRTSRSEIYNGPPAQGFPTDEPKPMPSGKKVPVYQNVMDKSNKIMFLADVEVITEDRDLVVKTKTSSTGKWQGSLPPGTYTVTVSKKETAERQRIQYSAKVIIPMTDKPFQLEDAVLV